MIGLKLHLTFFAPFSCLYRLKARLSGSVAKERQLTNDFPAATGTTTKALLSFSITRCAMTTWLAHTMIKTNTKDEGSNDTLRFSMVLG